MLEFFRKKTKSIMIAVAVVFAVSMFYGLRLTGGQGGTGGSKDIGKVNGRQIDQLRFREMVNRLARQFGGQLSPRQLPFIENMALGQTVDFMLIQAEAERRVRVPRQEVEMAIASIMKQQNVASKKALEEALKKAGLKYSDFENLIKQEIQVQKMVMKIRQEVKVTPNDLREVRASHILVSKEADAKRISQLVKQGDDFTALAKKYSLDPGSAVRGGDLGFFATGAMAEPFEQAAFKLKINEVSGIVKTPFGFHLIKVTDSRLRKLPKGGKDLEQAALMEKQDKVFQRWFNDLKQKAKIEITSPELKAIDLQGKGRIWEAIQEYKKAAAQNPANPYLNVYLADAYSAVGKKDLAVTEYETALAKAGGNIELYLIFGQAYEKWGDKTMALRQYRRASLVAGDSKPVHEALLKIFQKLGSAKDVQNENSEISRINKKENFLK